MLCRIYQYQSILAISQSKNVYSIPLRALKEQFSKMADACNMEVVVLNAYYCKKILKIFP